MNQIINRIAPIIVILNALAVVVFRNDNRRSGCYKGRLTAPPPSNLETIQ